MNATGLIIGIITALLVVGVIIWNNIWRKNAKNKKRISGEEYIKQGKH